MAAPEAIMKLVRKFQANFDYHQSDKFNEEDLRHEFLNPLFRELGWDLENEASKGADRDVKYEGKIKIGAPDFGFYIDNKRKFFVEAKNPTEKVCQDAEWAFQVRSYGYSAHLPLCILTDFEEFSIYDTTVRPKNNDKASVARLACIHYTEYESRWDEIVERFSRTAVAEGRLEEDVKRPAEAVDADFLVDLRRWRKDLAENIALRNPQLSEEEVKYSVRVILDRIVFLRICEDRGMEPEHTLQEVADAEDIYAGLLKLFAKADGRYDAKLFELGVEQGLEIDDKELKKIIRGFHFPESPYKFDAIPADILGQVYEQLLGEVIYLTEGHHARIKDKYELRHGSGIYYTESWVVEYIVERTIGPLVANKSPQDISELSIVDPACGSGSFLISAYQYLMDWYRDWYVHDGVDKHTKAGRIWIDNAGIWQLSLSERKDVLLRHIYGVDKDSDACDIAKLSLMLKALEAPEQRSLFGGRVLPELERNIKCGNSLIGTDINEIEEDQDKITDLNPFNWEAEFPEVFRRGGFDAVLGNPPYVRQELLGSQKEYFEKHFDVYASTADLYSYFIEKGIAILKPGGQFCYIVSNKWMRAAYGKPLRRWLKGQEILELTDFGHLRVFKNATTYTCILRATKNGQAKSFQAALAKTLDFPDLEGYVRSIEYPVEIASLSDDGWSLADPRTRSILAKMRATGTPLGQYVEGKIYRGIITGLNEAFIVDAATRGRLIKEDPKSAELIRPYLIGKDLIRHTKPIPELFIIAIPNGWTDSRSRGNAWDWLNANYSAIAGHLEPFEAKARKRQDKGAYWWELRSCDYYPEFEKSKICWGNLSNEAPFTIDDSGAYVNAPACFIPVGDEALLGVLNSRLLWWFLKGIAAGRQGGYIEAKPIYVEQLPIVDGKNGVGEFVRQILSLNEKLSKSDSEAEGQSLQRQIAAVDHQIDQLVYKLYGLSEEEIRIVEESAK